MTLDSFLESLGKIEREFEIYRQVELLWYLTKDNKRKLLNHVDFTGKIIAYEKISKERRFYEAKLFDPYSPEIDLRSMVQIDEDKIFKKVLLDKNTGKLFKTLVFNILSKQERAEMYCRMANDRDDYLKPLRARIGTATFDVDPVRSRSLPNVCMWKY